ncbi:class I SAM-dependent methyltransferase [Alicyclobacillus curvatus]|jgi:16S rRNA (guanine1207-N2)-methyltransferase|nr:class I SAM-dependent methyltransferase [Alicyclobacillus curvatus]
MNEHYYSERPTAKSEPRRFRCHVRGVDLELMSDAGVFSKTGLDFGTRLLIETVHLPDEAFVVDLGCGYGVVGAVLARIYPQTRWLLLDINERAVELAEQNTAALGERVQVAQSDGLNALGSRRPEAILLNPPIRAGKSAIYKMFEDASRKLFPGGALWVVIHKKHGAESAKKFLVSLFPEVEMVDRKSGYHVFRCLTSVPAQ